MNTNEPNSGLESRREFTDTSDPALMAKCQPTPKPTGQSGTPSRFPHISLGTITLQQLDEFLRNPTTDSFSFNIAQEDEPAYRRFLNGEPPDSEQIICAETPPAQKSGSEAG
jgi:hypothetical protein